MGRVCGEVARWVGGVVRWPGGRGCGEVARWVGGVVRWPGG